MGIDTVAKKNFYQYNSLIAKGCEFDVVAADKHSRFRKEEDNCVKKELRVYSCPNITSRIFCAAKLLIHNKYSHAELYAAGRLSLYYLFLLKLFRVNIILIERGDIGIFQKYDFFTKLSMKIAYFWSDRVWYKEPYMHNLLLVQRAKNLYFIPNAVPVPKGCISKTKENVFLWANRNIEQRRMHWAIDKLESLSYKYELNANFCGLTDHELNDFDKCHNDSLAFFTYSEMNEFYSASSFFVLPSKIVFGNYALLEAMSFGLVPVVTESDDVDLIVKDGHNGIVTKFSKESYAEGLEKAMNLTNDEYAELSQNALETIVKNFSSAQWVERVLKLYDFNYLN